MRSGCKKGEAGRRQSCTPLSLSAKIDANTCLCTWSRDRTEVGAVFDETPPASGLGQATPIKPAAVALAAVAGAGGRAYQCSGLEAGAGTRHISLRYHCMQGCVQADCLRLCASGGSSCGESGTRDEAEMVIRETIMPWARVLNSHEWRGRTSRESGTEERG